MLVTKENEIYLLEGTIEKIKESGNKDRENILSLENQNDVL